MRFQRSTLLFLSALAASHAFAPMHQSAAARLATPLRVSVGIGPEKDEKEVVELVAGVDYEVPDHELYRQVRRSTIDEKCDDWFGNLLEGDSPGALGDAIIDKTRSVLTTPVELKNDFRKDPSEEGFTPYVNEKLPWQPLMPSFGLEEFGLPVPRRNAETWRHFDVSGMVNQDYSGATEGAGTNMELSDDEVTTYKEKLLAKGGWLDDDAVTARLVYINGRFCPQLSLTTDTISNMASVDDADDEVKEYLERLTDGFTDKLAADVPSGKDHFLKSFAELSAPDHCVGEPTSQFAINSQQGTACFAALNTIKAGSVALIRNVEGSEKDTDAKAMKPVMLVNALTKDIGASGLEDGQGAACHPRALIVAEKDSRMSLIQTSVDIDEGEAVPTLYNGYTQIFVKEGAHLAHSYLEETGGMVTGNTEATDNTIPEGTTPPRSIESKRPALKDTHLEAMDVQLIGDDANYEHTCMSIGGSGRVRLALSAHLLRPGTNAVIKGFSLSGGAQRTDIKTNIHHVAQATSSEQIQKNMIGGRATGAFRGRIRVEQSAQQTASDQLSRTILLSDKSRSWSAPTLEIIADDVVCAHGATVSDLSEEELFYLRSRGLNQATARNMLMFAFAGDISVCIDPAMRGEIDSKSGVTQRVIQRLENLVPRGDRLVKGEFQSS